MFFKLENNIKRLCYILKAMAMFSFTRFYLRVLADLNEIIRRRKRNLILTITIEISVRFENHERGVRKDDKKRDLCKEVWINHDIRLFLGWGGSSENHSFEIRQFFPHFPGEFNVFLTEFIAVVCMDFADGVLHLL